MLVVLSGLCSFISMSDLYIIFKVKEFKNEVLLDMDEGRLRRRRTASSIRKRILFPEFAQR